MHATGITANLSVADLADARDFYVDFLGLSVEGFNLGWVVNLQSPDGRAVVQLVTRDATSPIDSVISVHVGDEVEAAYEEAQRRGFEIVHPLTAEPCARRQRRQHCQPQGQRRLTVARGLRDHRCKPPVEKIWRRRRRWIHAAQWGRF